MFHPNGWCIGVGLSSGVVKLYDVRVLKLLQHYGEHSDSVTKISFHPSGKYLLSTSSDSTVKVIFLLNI